MKLLRINDKKGEFSVDGEIFKPIDTINREDIEKVLKVLLKDNKEFLLDDPSKNEIVVPSQKIIYEKIYKKLFELLNERNSIKNKVDNLFRDAFEKYTS